MIIAIKINDVISITEGLHKITMVGKKTRVRPSDMKRNMGTVDIFRSEYAKKKKMIEELNLSQDYQATSEV